jgi:hypothetical protein
MEWRRRAVIQSFRIPHSAFPIFSASVVQKEMIMSVELNIGSDFVTVIDGLESLVLRREGATVDEPVPHALRIAVSERESASSGGTLLLSDVHFHLPAAEVPIAPVPNDKLIDAAGIVWVIQQVQTATCATRWNCLCRQE